MHIFQFLTREQFRASLELINGWLFSHLAISEGVGLKNPVFRLNKSLCSAFEKERNTCSHPPTHTPLYTPISMKVASEKNDA